MNDIESTLIALIAKHAEVDASMLHPETLIADTGLDSMGVVELIFDIEETWDVSIDNTTEIQNRLELGSIKDMASTLQEKLLVPG